MFSEQLNELNLDGIPSERQQSNSEYYYTSTHISLNQSLYFLAELKKKRRYFQNQLLTLIKTMKSGKKKS